MLFAWFVVSKAMFQYVLILGVLDQRCYFRLLFSFDSRWLGGGGCSTLITYFALEGGGGVIIKVFNMLGECPLPHSGSPFQG